MRLHKILFFVTLISSIIILVGGIYLKLYDENSSGYSSGRTGSNQQITINGNGTILIGIIILLLSLFSFRMIKYNKTEREKLDSMIYPKKENIRKKSRRKKSYKKK